MRPKILQVRWRDAYLSLDDQGTAEELAKPSGRQVLYTPGHYLGHDSTNIYLGLDAGRHDLRGKFEVPLPLVSSVTILGPLASLTGKDILKFEPRELRALLSRCAVRGLCDDCKASMAAMFTITKNGPASGAGVSRKAAK